MHGHCPWAEGRCCAESACCTSSELLAQSSGKGLSQDLNQVNVLHDYIGHLSIVMGEVVDLQHTHIALGKVRQVVQHHNLGVEGQVHAELDKVLAKWEAASVVAVIPILAIMLGTGAHDG